MIDRTIYVETVESEVCVNLKDVMAEVNDDDIFEWIEALSVEEKVRFVQGLGDYFDDISCSDVLNNEQTVEASLDILIEACEDSSYDRTKILDKLKLAKIIK